MREMDVSLFGGTTSQQSANQNSPTAGREGWGFNNQSWSGGNTRGKVLLTILIFKLLTIQKDRCP